MIAICPRSGCFYPFRLGITCSWCDELVDIIDPFLSGLKIVEANTGLGLLLGAVVFFKLTEFTQSPFNVGPYWDFNYY